MIALCVVQNSEETTLRIKLLYDFFRRNLNISLRPETYVQKLRNIPIKFTLLD